MKKTRIGIIGVGGIACGVHIPGYLQTENCEITAICDIDEAKLQKVGDDLHVPQERRFTDYHDLIACPDVDAVDIATWNSMHCPIAQEAIKAGKCFSVEKPVGMNYAETRALADAAKDNGVTSFVCLSWRYRPYTRYMKYLVDQGKLGKLYHIYIRCIKDSGLWEGRKREWRFDRSRAGSGVLGDLGAHMIDYVHFLGESFRQVYALADIVIKERPDEKSDAILPADTDDWCNIVAKLDSETACTIQLSRCATTVGDLIEFELYGEKGKLVYTYLEGNQSIVFTDAKTKEAVSLTPPASFETVQSSVFVNSVNGVFDDYAADMTEGLACQAVIDATLCSIEENRAVAIEEIAKKGE